jgi:hypothetical protein
MTRRAKAAGLSVVAIVVVAALVTLLVASPSGPFAHSGSSPAPKDPVLTLAQANDLAGRAGNVTSELPADLTSLAGPLQSVVSAASALPTKPGAGTAGQLVDLAHAAITLSGQLNPIQGQLPVAAIAAEQRDLSPSELAAEQSGFDSFESQFAGDQTQLNSLQSMVAALPAVSSTGTAVGAGTNGGAATLDSYTATSTATPSVISSLIAIAHQVDGPAQQLLTLYEQITQGNLFAVPASAYTAVQKMIPLVNELDRDAYTIRVDVGTILKDSAASVQSNPVTLGMVKTGTGGGGAVELDARVYGRLCIGNVVFCWTIDNGPLASNILGGVNLAASVITDLSLLPAVASFGATLPVTAVLDGVAVITAVDQFVVDSYRIDYSTPVAEVLQLASDAVGVAFSVFGLGSVADELKAARSEASIKNVEEEIALIKKIGASLPKFKAPFEGKLAELAADETALKEAKTIADERAKAISLFGVATSISDAYTGPFAKPIQQIVKRLYEDIYHDLFPPKPAVPVTWQTRPQVLSFPADGNPTSVSCIPGFDSCDVVTAAGYEVTVGARGSSTPKQIDPVAAGLSVSCTRPVCVAVNQFGTVVLNAFGAGEPVGWQTPRLIDPHVSAPNTTDNAADNAAVSCDPTANFCMLVDIRGYAYAYDNNTGKWSSLGEPDPNGKGFSSVSCATFQFCAATEFDGAIITYNGHAWSSPDELSHDSLISSVSCPTTTFCAAVDHQGDAFTYNGHTWTKEPFIDTGTTAYGQPAGFYSVSCPTSAFCEAVDNLGRVVSYQGSSWGHPTPVDTYAGTRDGMPESISCSSASFCVLADGTGNVLVKAPDTSKQPTPPPTAPTSNQTGPSTSTPQVATWGAPDTIDPPNPADPAQYLTSVSCPTTTFCMAVDGNGNHFLAASAGNVFIYNGSSWSQPRSVANHSGGFADLSCPTSTFCAAFLTYGGAITYHGSSWSSPDNIDSSPSNYKTVSCSSPSFCLAVGVDGSNFVYDGSSWRSIPSPPVLVTSGAFNAVSCSSATFCMAVDRYGNAFTYNGASWSGPDLVDQGTQLDSVSCPTTTFCVTVDGQGNAFTYDGSSWSTANSIDPSGSGLNSVSCSSATFCVAVDATHAIVYKVS